MEHGPRGATRRTGEDDAGGERRPVDGGWWRCSRHDRRRRGVLAETAGRAGGAAVGAQHGRWRRSSTQGGGNALEVDAHRRGAVEASGF